MYFYYLKHVPSIHSGGLETIFSTSCIFHNISVQLFDAAALWCQRNVGERDRERESTKHDRKKPELIYIQYTSLASSNALRMLGVAFAVPDLVIKY